MRRLIDADELVKETDKSMQENLHDDSKIALNHRAEHMHFLNLIAKQPIVTDERITKALGLAWQYGQIDGNHHKMWVIDQMVRVLCGSEKEYKKWIDKYERPLKDGDYYSWDKGINP